MVALVGAAGCDSPIAPQPDELTAVCPVPVTADTQTQAGTAVNYVPPSVSGGVPPYTSTCFPASGSTFPVGQTTVACNVRDAQQAQASCSFTVTVRLVVVPMLGKTRFLAFGDSITAGIVSEDTVDLLPTESYPSKLETLLRQFYPAEDIRVMNKGEPGETLPNGRVRLPGVLDADRPQVLLLLEGVNNLPGYGVPNSTTDLRAMVDAARSRGIEVIISKLTPAYPPRSASLFTLIPELNQQIDVIALQRQISPAVDSYTLIANMPSLMGPDGLHPTRAGYAAMAQLFFQHIVSRYDTHAVGGMMP